MNQSLKYYPGHCRKYANLLLNYKMRDITITLKTFARPKGTLQNHCLGKNDDLLIFCSLVTSTKKDFMYEGIN